MDQTKIDPLPPAPRAFDEASIARFLNALPKFVAQANEVAAKINKAGAP